MRDVTQDVQAAGGAITRAALRELGHSYGSIRAAVRGDRLAAVGRFWVVVPDADPAIAHALRLGGVVGGASALRTYGVWVTAIRVPHVAMRPNAGRPAAPGTLQSWLPFELDAQPWRVSITDALAQHARLVERDDAIASIDSAWHRGLLDPAGIDRLFELLPRRCRPWRRLLDPRAESGLETLVRVPCRERGWRVESQAPAPGGGWSDLLIDGWLYVEADGSEWHDNEKQAARDRRRNTAISLAGGRWLRFGYADVVHERARTIGAIAQVLAQGRPRMAS